MRFFDLLSAAREKLTDDLSNGQQKSKKRKSMDVDHNTPGPSVELPKGIYPACVQLRFNINSTRSESVRKIWERCIKECKEKMIEALLDDLFVKYSTLRDSINSDYDQLTGILDEGQIREIKDSLKKRDVGIAPMLELKTKRQFEPPKPQPRPKQRTVMVPKKRKMGQ